MDETKPTLTLHDAAELLPQGYALDLVAWLSNNPEPHVGAEAEVGDLFRTLVLDERWSVDDAAAVYKAGIAALAKARESRRPPTEPPTPPRFSRASRSTRNRIRGVKR